MGSPLLVREISEKRGFELSFCHFNLGKIIMSEVITLYIKIRLELSFQRKKTTFSITKNTLEII